MLVWDRRPACDLELLGRPQASRETRAAPGHRWPRPSLEILPELFNSRPKHFREIRNARSEEVRHENVRS